MNHQTTYVAAKAAEQGDWIPSALLIAALAATAVITVWWARKHGE
jgi:hypothetical protein